MNPIERVAVATWMSTKLKAITSTHDPDTERCELDELYREQYERDGIRSKDVVLFGRKVGTYSARLSKEKPATPAWTEQKPVLQDTEGFTRWLQSMDSDTLADVAFWMVHGKGADADAFTRYWFELTGEVPGGCELLTTEHAAKPSVPPQFTGTSLRIDEAAMDEAMAPTLTAEIYDLLEGGRD